MTYNDRIPRYYTAGEIAGADRIPELYAVTSHLVFSSPATLAYNSPGAEGFGVKRAGLAVPDSVMLIVSPGCCGRNTSSLSSLEQYRRRFFYLEMDETDLVTGRHLEAVPQAVKEITDSLEKKPSVVMICATCVDALLGTDWDRVCRRAEEEAGVRVRPCYMYALTREGTRPPMVHVRQSLYSLLNKRRRDSRAVSLLGFFAPVKETSELFYYLHLSGIRNIREISRCRDYAGFEEMAEANFNLVLNPEARPAADDLSERLGIPYVELSRFYDPDRIHRQYKAFFQVIGLKTEEEEQLWKSTSAIVDHFHKVRPGLTISVGESVNADPYELALALAGRGAIVKEVFGTVTEENRGYISRLAQTSPDTRLYSNQDPTMLFYEDASSDIDLTIGKDAHYYHPGAKHLYWNEDIQPFGYSAVRELYSQMEQILGTGNA